MHGDVGKWCYVGDGSELGLLGYLQGSLLDHELGVDAGTVIMANLLQLLLGQTEELGSVQDA